MDLESNDKLARYKVNEEVYMNLINRLQHIAAVLIGQPCLEKFIEVKHETIRYEDDKDLVRFNAELKRMMYGGINLDLCCPFSMLTDMCDYEIIKWRDERMAYTEEEKPKEPDIEKPLSTSGGLSKKQLIEYLQKADIDDDAQLTLKFDRDSGKYYLFFYWSEGPGAFGHRAVDFDIESKEMIEKGWSWLEKD